MSTDSRDRREASGSADPAQNDAASGAATEAPEQRDGDHIEEHSRLRAPVIYEIVRREGDVEMSRPATSLWWSGVAAGLSISFSLLAEAILQKHLPDAAWRPLVSGFGYCVGFLMVVLARQQLFTENTVTAVLPMAAEFTWRNLRRVARLWSIVFAANMTGTLFAALFCTFTPVLPPGIRETMLEISGGILVLGPVDAFFRAITAGFLIAAMAWLIPSAEGAKFHVVTLLTYLIAIGDFTHIVAGSVEAFLLVVDGQLALGRMLAGFTIPVLLGNIVGGTALFALIAYAQVKEEMVPGPRSPDRPVRSPGPARRSAT